MQLGTDTRITAENNAATQVGTSRRTADATEFFGADGLSWHDVVDAINPLEHIPIISELFDSATDHTPSTAAKLAGGALLGGPLGFIASLASVIFETQTGHGIGGAVLAALSGDQTPAPTTEFAENDAAPVNASLAAPVDAVSVSDQSASLAIPAISQQIAANNVPTATPANTVLDLYGASPGSAHSSYKKAQMLPYLHDVTVSQVL